MILGHRSMKDLGLPLPHFPSIHPPPPPPRCDDGDSRNSVGPQAVVQLGPPQSLGRGSILTPAAELVSK